MTDPTDRLAEIKEEVRQIRVAGGPTSWYDWLIAEVERLRAEREQWVNSKEYMDWWCATKEVNE